ncbi:MAG: YggS family pyridoxal phosphate enzyme, partial [Gammaproteobacteria bacterium]
PEPCSDFEQQRVPFRLLKNLFDDACRICPGLDTLSMGTTQDMRAAIAEGSTMVRIGTALFGLRT